MTGLNMTRTTNNSKERKSQMNIECWKESLVVARNRSSGENRAMDMPYEGSLAFAVECLLAASLVFVILARTVSFSPNLKGASDMTNLEVYLS